MLFEPLLHCSSETVREEKLFYYFIVLGNKTFTSPSSFSLHIYYFKLLYWQSPKFSFLLNILIRADFSFFLKFLLLKLLKILIPMILFDRKSLQLRVCQLKIFDSQLFLKLLMLIECKRHRWSIKLTLIIIFRVANTSYLVLFSFILFFHF